MHQHRAAFKSADGYGDCGERRHKKSFANVSSTSSYIGSHPLKQDILKNILNIEKEPVSCANKLQVIAQLKQKLVLVGRGGCFAQALGLPLLLQSNISCIFIFLSAQLQEIVTVQPFSNQRIKGKSTGNAVPYEERTYRKLFQLLFFMVVQNATSLMQILLNFWQDAANRYKISPTIAYRQRRMGEKKWQPQAAKAEGLALVSYYLTIIIMICRRILQFYKYCHVHAE